MMISIFILTFIMLIVTIIYEVIFPLKLKCKFYRIKKISVDIVRVEKNKALEEVA